MRCPRVLLPSNARRQPRPLAGVGCTPLLGRVTIVFQRKRVLASGLGAGKYASYRHDEQQEENDKRWEYPRQPR